MEAWAAIPVAEAAIRAAGVTPAWAVIPEADSPAAEADSPAAEAAFPAGVVIRGAAGGVVAEAVTPEVTRLTAARPLMIVISR